MYFSLEESSLELFPSILPIPNFNNNSYLYNSPNDSFYNSRRRITIRSYRYRKISPYTRISLNHNPLIELEKKLFGNGKFDNEFKEKIILLLKKKRIKKKFGKLLIESIMKLIKNNFLNIVKMKSLYKLIFVSYMYFREKKYYVKKFIKCLPNLNVIKYIIGKYNNSKMQPKNNENSNNIINVNNNSFEKLFYKDILFIKMILDIYDDFLNNNTYFEDIKFIKNYFLISINFYKEINNEIFDKIKVDIFNKYKIDFYKMKNKVNYNSMDKDDYIEYLEEKQNNYINLIGGINDNNNLFIQ